MDGAQPWFPFSDTNKGMRCRPQSLVKCGKAWPEVMEGATRIELQDLSKVQEFDHVNAPLTTLQPGHKRLVFAPEWTAGLPDRDIVLKKVRGIDFRIGLGVAWNKEDPTAARDDIIDIARSPARPGR